MSFGGVFRVTRRHLFSYNGFRHGVIRFCWDLGLVFRCRGSVLVFFAPSIETSFSYAVGGKHPAFDYRGIIGRSIRRAFSLRRFAGFWIYLLHLSSIDTSEGAVPRVLSEVEYKCRFQRCRSLSMYLLRTASSRISSSALRNWPISGFSSACELFPGATSGLVILFLVFSR